MEGSVKPRVRRVGIDRPLVTDFDVSASAIPLAV